MTDQSRMGRTFQTEPTCMTCRNFVRDIVLLRKTRKNALGKIFGRLLAEMSILHKTTPLKRCHSWTGLCRQEITRFIEKFYHNPAFTGMSIRHAVRIHLLLFRGFPRGFPGEGFYLCGDRRPEQSMQSFRKVLWRARKTTIRESSSHPD